MENHYNCIYMYANKINGKRYVGQTIDFNKRHKKHISSSYNKKREYDYNYPFHRAIRKYGIKNFEIKILADNIQTQDKINEYEIFFIKRYNTLCKNGKGYNVANGGSNGNPYAGKTEDEMEKFRRNQSKTMKGKFCGENHPMYGKYHSDETKQKISENHADVKGKNHPRAKRVAQYDLNGNIIKIWDYAKQVEEELGIYQGNICKCCKGKYKSAGGFVWKYADEPTE